MSENLFRLYESTDRSDGYPQEWHDTIKHQVREEAGHRCIRCKHPYKVGEHPMELVNGKYESWSPCDVQCEHDGPLRLVSGKKVISSIPVLSQGFVAGDAVRIHAPVAVQAYARILTVHHLDEVKLNCRWWNLLSLCQKCHLTIQGKVKPHRPYMFEHSTWFKPYVAGFYAWKHLGEELSREQTMARLEELLALGRGDLQQAERQEQA